MAGSTAQSQPHDTERRGHQAQPLQAGEGHTTLNARSGLQPQTLHAIPPRPLAPAPAAVPSTLQWCSARLTLDQSPDLACLLRPSQPRPRQRTCREPHTVSPSDLPLPAPASFPSSQASARCLRLSLGPQHPGLLPRYPPMHSLTPHQPPTVTPLCDEASPILLPTHPEALGRAWP